MRANFFVLGTLLTSLAVQASAVAAPILPAQDRSGALIAYQGLTPPDRKATLEAFTQKKVSGDKFDSLDACTLRETTEPDAPRAKLAKAIADCAKETGI